MPTRRQPLLIAPRRGGGTVRTRKGGKFNFGHFMSGVGKGALSAGKFLAPIVIPMAGKALMGAGPPKKRGRKKGGATRKPQQLIGYY